MVAESSVPLQPSRRLVRAAISMVCGAVLISFSPVFVKATAMEPTAIGFWRMAFGGTALVVLALLSPRVHLPSRRALLLMFGAAACLCIDLVAWHRSIVWIGPGLATILVNLQVFVLAGYGVLVLRERVSWRLGLAIPLAFAGLFLLVGMSWGVLGRTHHVGVLLGLVAATGYAAYLLLLRAAQVDPKANTIATVALVSVSCAVILGFVALAEGERIALPDVETAALLAGYGLGPHVLGWLLITRSLAVLKASRAGLILLLQPALAFVWDMALFDRPTSQLELAGASLALVAIYLGSAPEPRRQPVV